MTTKIEYRVRPVTRYVVTRYTESEDADGCGSFSSECLGEFDHEPHANEVGSRLAEADGASFVGILHDGHTAPR
ncbi:hypothetical protein [Albimonas pacifica]|uniref:Uncharacterized protein n=1 Tax=Albimonas pacifica TaxID=1114924 RepID=A0A1I3LJ54_9RHOB|nr:hypothetical protein [Albimonas pacifica]SFI84829.1 hypothetical protein SAMN05216258_11058 [Albimonas pacifica]